MAGLDAWEITGLQVPNKAETRTDAVLRLVLPYVKGKKVLDIGCVEHDISRKNAERVWVHDVLREHVAKLVGLDIAERSIEALRHQGYDVSCQSAETFTLSDRFDVIFCGELIEHLENPGLMLDRCRQHLNPGGTLILTTPNAFSLYRLLSTVLRLTNDPEVNAEHVAWYSPAVLRQLLARHGFRIQALEYADYPHLHPQLKHRLTSWLCSILGTRFRETMVLVAR